jgi:hypothetical protein
VRWHRASLSAGRKKPPEASLKIRSLRGFSSELARMVVKDE